MMVLAELMLIRIAVIVGRVLCGISFVQQLVFFIAIQLFALNYFLHNQQQVSHFIHLILDKQSLVQT